ncbi:MAG: MCE family protein [Kiritimatiellae bacterium]|nr:MCE family protein [Kiritimatiellia bacterium]
MSRKRKNDVFSEAVVGLFMIAVLGLLVYFTVIISGVDVLKGRQKVVASVAFSSVGGLKDHDNVMYRGTKVGGVEGIEVTPSNLIVRIEIDQSVVLRESYRITVCSLSMLGGQFLMLEEGEGEVVGLTDSVLRGEAPTDWMQDVSRIASNLKRITSDESVHAIITNVEATSAAAREIAGRLERGEGTLGHLLSADDTVYRDMTNAVADAKAMLANAAEISERIKAGEGTVGKLLSSDADLYADLKESVAAFKKACERIRLPENLDRDVADIVAGAGKLLANLNEVSERLKNGEGTLGKLTAESEMYDEVKGVIKDVRQVLDNYRDTTPISTFGSLIMGGL